MIIHIEKTIPLENIQDLSFIGGPILRYFGLTLIKIETAGGGGGAHNQNLMSMLGINDAENFKSHILSEREKLILSALAVDTAFTGTFISTSNGLFFRSFQSCSCLYKADKSGA